MPPRPRGFTLIELVTVLLIVALVGAIALPRLAEAMARHRLGASAEALLDTLERARTAAVRRNHATRTCASANGHTCQDWVDWTRGWIAYDEERHTVFDRVDALDAALSAHRGHRLAVRFDEDGTTADNQRITLCVRGRAATAVSIVVPKSGVARRERAKDDDATACALAGTRR
ncbi:GspH/FimT family pseudopilin [Luteibacter flocculans]|uniref:Type II secretion system protein H n=1 Tax=Luteibacter flocculans TaxID=2780091 RepID=A0ABY4T8K7_9GAMM|nr:GspH/FimT family pseudopilin [Luteibacter flocculans]URL60283.1 GspH/FimT family pseudopilin [Luteibacter flocculans]